MSNNFMTCTRLYAFGIVASLMLVGAPATAQFRPRVINGPAIGESYHIEAAAGFWFPSADIGIASGGSGTLSGIAGTPINAKADLGLTDQHFGELHVTLRPVRSSKFRFQYIPITYDQTSSLTRTINFNGQRYTLGVPVNSSIDWKAYRFGYEYDFIIKNRGFGGFVLDFKYTDVTATLASTLRSDFVHARAPIPALGGIFRVYALPNVSVTGEITGFKLPDKLVKNATGHYVDVDFYGTMSFTPNVGAQLGFRSFDVGYVVDSDTGNFTLKGLYLGFVARY